MFDHIVHGRKPNGKWVAGAVAASIVAHLLILVLLLGLGGRGLLLADEMAGDGPSAADDQGAGGGGGGGGDAGEQVTYYEVSAPIAPPVAPPVPVPPEVEVLPPVVPPPVTPPPTEQPKAQPAPPAAPAPTPAPPTQPGTGGGAGGNAGAGQGPGTGSGAGPGSGGGSGGGTGGGVGTGTGPGTAGGEGSVIPPVADLQLFPPDPPRALRGRAVEVTVAVNELGAVTGADVTISSGDRRYDQLLRRQAMEWHFRPARDRTTGRPVAVRYPIGFDI
ncbi:MAG TPA: energy transducer TonB [Longimicrobium sp.]